MYSLCRSMFVIYLITKNDKLIINIYICLIPVSLHKDHLWDRLMS